RPPHRPPAFPLPEDCWDGDGHLVYNAEVGVRSAVVRVDVRTGKEEAEDGPLHDPASAKGRREQGRSLLPPPHAFLRSRALGEARVVTWENEGLKLEGVLTTPLAGVAKAPYPLVLYPHGGPHSRTSLGFDFTVQTFAAHGYAVFQPNFRGSSG